MLDSTLLVPGTSGCKLLANGADIGWPTELMGEAWLAGATGISVEFEKLGLSFSTQQLTELLSMEFAAGSTVPTKTSLAAGKSIAPGDILRAAYNQFLDFQVFSYDWRSDLRHTGQLLLDRLKNRPAGSKWRIVAHSQGGLAVVVASKLYAAEHGGSDTAFADLVSHVAFIATPFHGTINAARALLVADNLTPPFAAAFKKIVRTWPAIHQMLPVWPGCVRTTTPRNDTPQFNLTYEVPWAGLSVSSDMLKRARDTRAQFLRNPFSCLLNVKVLAYFSEAWNTANHLLLDGATLKIAPDADGERGDTLVPAQTIRTMSHQIELDRFFMLGRDHQTMPHFMLSIDNVVAPHVKAFLNT